MSNRRLQTNQLNGTVRKRHRTFKVLTVFCCNLKFLTHFKDRKLEINQSTYQNRRHFVDLELTGFLLSIIHLIFTVWNYILEKNDNNVSPVTIALFYSFVEHNAIISY